MSVRKLMMVAFVALLVIGLSGLLAIPAEAGYLGLDSHRTIWQYSVPE